MHKSQTSAKFDVVATPHTKSNSNEKNIPHEQTDSSDPENANKNTKTSEIDTEKRDVSPNQDLTDVQNAGNSLQNNLTIKDPLQTISDKCPPRDLLEPSTTERKDFFKSVYNLEDHLLDFVNGKSSKSTKGDNEESKSDANSGETPVIEHCEELEDYEKSDSNNQDQLDMLQKIFNDCGQPKDNENEIETRTSEFPQQVQKQATFGGCEEVPQEQKVEEEDHKTTFEDMSFSKSEEVPQSINPSSLPPVPPKTHSPLLFVDVNLGPSRMERIVVYEGDTATALAEKFTKQHNLNPLMKQKLIELLNCEISGILERIDEENSDFCSSESFNSSFQNNNF